MWNKHLGQHFLINKKIVTDIICAGEVSKKDVVLEVGPGKGALTETLGEKAKKVIAVEKDKGLVAFLKNKFENQKNIEIIYGDILNSEVRLPLGSRTSEYKIIANIPYYITSRFLRIFLSRARLRSSLMVLMIQREVAERIVGTHLHQGFGKTKKESLLSLSVKAYGKPEIVKIVKRGNFSPPPKVDSAIIKISGISDRWMKKNNIIEKKFFEILRKAFQQKRKMLRHSLGKNIPEKYASRRPEELGLEKWKAIYYSQSPKSPKL